MQHLFIYGTLAPGHINHYVIADIPGVWQAATLRGELFAEGWGADAGCPGIVPFEQANKVPGYLFSSEYLNENWQRLDEFEGEGYKRVSVCVATENGEKINAFVYALSSFELLAARVP